MKNYAEKERKLDDVLKELNTKKEIFTNIGRDMSDLESQKNQLISEKKRVEEKYQKLLHEHHSLQKQLDGFKKDLNENFFHKDKISEKVDELSQETEVLIGEIDKWQT